MRKIRVHHCGHTRDNGEIFVSYTSKNTLGVLTDSYRMTGDLSIMLKKTDENQEIQINIKILNCVTYAAKIEEKNAKLVQSSHSRRFTSRAVSRYFASSTASCNKETKTPHSSHISLSLPLSIPLKFAAFWKKVKCLTHDLEIKYCDWRIQLPFYSSLDFYLCHLQQAELSRSLASHCTRFVVQSSH